MSDIIVEPNKSGEGYRAVQSKKTIATGDTQEKAAINARKKSDDPIVAARVRKVEGGSPDKFRRLYPPKR